MREFSLKIQGDSLPQKTDPFKMAGRIRKAFVKKISGVISENGNLIIELERPTELNALEVEKA